MIRGLVVAAALAGGGCRAAPSRAAVAAPPVGTSIAIYQDAGQAIGVVDDRRWVELRERELVLDGIDPAASLSSLVIEPLGDGPLAVGACTRDRVAWAHHGDGIPARPALATPIRCAVTGARGRRLVRVLYVAPSLRYQTLHDISLHAGDRATVATRFTLTTPATMPALGRAEVALFAGVPGGEHAPREIARGTVELDGSTAILAAPPRELDARLERIYRGARDFAADDDNPWSGDPPDAIWVWLVLDAVALPAGAFGVHVAVPGEGERFVETGAARRRDLAGATRVPLWIDDRLHGIRKRTVGGAEDAELIDRFVITVANTGDAAREVWLEEPLRPAKRRVVAGRGATRPQLVDDVARVKLQVGAGGLARASYGLVYEP